jgi:branched-chain amino acid transport system permease protein
MTFVQTLVNGVVLGSLFALMAVGLTLIFGILRVINFAHGVLFMLGAYGVWVLHERVDVPYVLAVVVSALGVGAVGGVLELTVMRRFRGLLVEGAIVAISLAVLVQNAVVLAAPSAPQSVSTPFTGAADVSGVILGWQRLFVLASACMLIGALAWTVRRTRVGIGIRALQQDPYAARLQGIEPNVIAPVVFTVGAALAGLAGALIAPLQQVVPSMGDQPLLASFVVVVLGGLGSVGGTFAAAMAIGVVQSVVTTYWSEPAAVAVSFLVAIAVLVVRPRGLFGDE